MAIVAEISEPDHDNALTHGRRLIKFWNCISTQYIEKYKVCVGQL